MAHEIIMIVPKADAFLTFPVEYHSDARIDCESREAQVASIGEAVVKAVEIAQRHPNIREMPHMHFVVMFAKILQDDA